MDLRLQRRVLTIDLELLKYFPKKEKFFLFRGGGFISVSGTPDVSFILFFRTMEPPLETVLNNSKWNETKRNNAFASLRRMCSVFRVHCVHLIEPHKMFVHMTRQSRKNARQLNKLTKQQSARMGQLTTILHMRKSKSKAQPLAINSKTLLQFFIQLISGQTARVFPNCQLFVREVQVEPAPGN